MADLSKIKLNGTTYNFKDAEARTSIENFQETDPSVQPWAKAAQKPSYTYVEVGALPSSYTPPVTSVNNTTGDVVVDKLKTTAGANTTEYNLIGTATSNGNTSAVEIYNPTLISFAKNPNSLARLTLGSTTTPGTIRLYSSTTNATGYIDLKSGSTSTNTRQITFPDATGTVALTSDIPSVPSWALQTNKPSYTFSELTTTPTSIQGYGITDAYTKTEVDGLVSGVLHYKGTKATVSALPNSGNTTGDVWHITADGSEYA